VQLHVEEYVRSAEQDQGSLLLGGAAAVLTSGADLGLTDMKTEGYEEQ
jgi:hypothetical protein